MKIYSGTIEVVVHPVVEPDAYAGKKADELKDIVVKEILTAEWKTD